MKNRALLLCLLLTVFSCAKHNEQSIQGPTGNNQLSLKNAFADHFKMGVAINNQQANNTYPESSQVITQHYNSLTPENDMKWEIVQPSEGVFDFSGADAIVKKAKAENLQLIGHTLVWHSQVPDWVFEDDIGAPASKELLIERMRTHIFALAGRYKDDVYGWDVLNEALNDDGTLRNSKWLQIIGKEYIELAFIFAHEAAPNAKLYYNDYNMFKPAKRAGAIAIAQNLIDKGIPIHGIGAQGHYPLDAPIDQLEQSIIEFSALGVGVVISELDITVIPFPDPENMGADVSLNFELDSFYNPYADGISEQSASDLRDMYVALFKIFVKHADKIDRVTFWGISDGNSWRNNWPMNGRTDYPLLFDREYKPKPFMDKIIALGDIN